MNDLPFLTHDIGARNDPKLMDLQMEMGGQGLAIFWCLVEMLWENGGFIPANYRSIAFALRWCKAAEVEKVVTGFELFQVEDGMITSASARERIRVKREKVDQLTNARRIAGQASGRARQRKPDEQTGTNDEQMFNKTEQTGTSIDISINQSINKSIDNNNIPPTADDFFIKFFFRNLKEPATEAQRFVKHYGDRGWTYQDGSPVTDIEKAADDWHPAKSGPRFNQEALNWYRAVWNAARDRVPDAENIFLRNLRLLDLSGQKLTIRFKTKEDAATASRFIIDNDLAGDWIIDFRFSN